MGYKKIEKKSFRYTILSAYARLVNRYFYRKVEVVGKENIPEEGPVIFVANHQNALMDALAILLHIKHQPVFLARADIFKNRIIAELLYFIKILPIYRIRDGVSNLQKNDQVFDKTVEILEKKRYLAMFPEGNHAGFRKLRMLQKGVSRIAFLAEEKNNFNLNLKIIPVGIDYSNYSKIRGTLFVNFGKPFLVLDFKDAYLENEQKGMNELRNFIRERIREQMIDIRHDEHYETVLGLRQTYNSRMRNRLGIIGKNLHDQFQADKVMTEKLNKLFDSKQDELKELAENLNKFQSGIMKLKLKPWVFDKKRYSRLGLILHALLLVIAFPMALYGFIMNFIPYWVPEKVAKKIKDEQFKSSFKWALAYFIFPLYYLILILSFCLLTHGMWLKIAFGFSLPVLGMFTLFYNSWFKAWRLKWRYQFMTDDKDFKTDLHVLRKGIIEKLDDILDNTAEENYNKV